MLSLGNGFGNAHTRGCVINGGNYIVQYNMAPFQIPLLWVSCNMRHGICWHFSNVGLNINGHSRIMTMQTRKLLPKSPNAEIQFSLEPLEA